MLIDRDFTKEGIVYNDLKLPDDLIRMNEDLDDATIRILIEETGLSSLKLKQFRSFGSLNRLKRIEHDLEWLRQNDRTEEHIITIAYYSLINMAELKSTEMFIKDNVNSVRLMK